MTPLRRPALRLLPLALLAACAPAATPAADSTPAAASAAPAPGAAGSRPTPSRLLVRPGVDVLGDSLPPALAGRRVGLVTNHTGRDAGGRTTIDILHEHPGLDLVALYGPEHGIRGAAAPGETVDSSRDERTGLPVHSLYGATRKPTPAMLRGIEALVFDIQDVGARQYTYIYTMALAMQAAAEAGIPFVVLDRPNPVRGDVVAGGRLDTAAVASFVGMYDIASRHGMTVGELARMFNAELRFGTDLTVVPMDGWRRDLWWDETGLDWVPPSPNLPTVESAIHYPGTVFFEAANIQEGRGTDHPFQQTGAPWMDGARVVAAMDALALPGVRFEAVRFTPVASAAKYGGVALGGVRLHVTDRAAYRPIPTVLRLIAEIRRAHPGDFAWVGGPGPGSPNGVHWLDRLTGDARARRAIEADGLDALFAAWEGEARAFEARRRAYLLY